MGMEQEKPMEEKNKTFRPSRRRLFDLLLLLNSSLMIILVFKSFSVFMLGMACLLLSIITIFIWFFIFTPLMTIKIAGNIITGRDEKFVLQSIPFRKIHFTNTIISPEGMGRRFFKDIYSVDGKKICIQRLFLGEEQVSTIVRTIEKHPFREGST